MENKITFRELWDKDKTFYPGTAFRKVFQVPEKQIYSHARCVSLLWLLFFDQNNLIERQKLNKEYDQLLLEREYYLKQNKRRQETNEESEDQQ